jgi:hypothetical protein
MIRGFVFCLLLVFLPGSEAASSGKGKALGSVADTAHGSSGGGGGSAGRALTDPRKAPPLDESRKVTEQDCSKPLDPHAGNLRCK